MGDCKDGDELRKPLLQMQQEQDDMPKVIRYRRRSMKRGVGKISSRLSDNPNAPTLSADLQHPAIRQAGRPHRMPRCRCWFEGQLTTRRRRRRAIYSILGRTGES